MTKYQQLFNTGAKQEEIDDIKRRFSSNQVFTWEEYYWGTKCIVEYDSDESSPDLIIKSLKKAFRNGLTVLSNPGIYQDALRIISTFYSAFGKYEQVINHLMIYVDSLGEAAPDWAFHDLINAQMHTDQIEIMLENPQSFLSDLGRNDNLSPDVEKKQKNLFRDFLVCAADYIKQNSKINVCVKDLATAAEEYDLLNFEAWKLFSAVISHSEPPETTIPSIPDGKDKTGKDTDNPKTTKVPADSKKPTQENPGTLGESEGADSHSEKDKTIEKLKKEIEEYQGKISALESQITERDEKNASLEARLTQSEQKGSLVRAKLSETEKKLLAIQQELKESSDRYNDLRKKIATGAKVDATLRAEISRLEEQLNNLSKEKQAAESELAVLQKKYASAERQIEADEGFKFQLQDAIRSLSAQIIQLKNDLEEANRRLEDASQPAVEEEDQEETAPSEMEIFGRCFYYLNYTCLEVGKEWLRVKLSKVSKNILADCIMPALTNSQARTATERGWTTIYDFDLASILKIIKYNLRRIPSFIPSKQEEKTVSDMIDIRNDYAHGNGLDISVEDAAADIETMSNFIKLMGGDQDTIEEMLFFASTITV